MLKTPKPIVFESVEIFNEVAKSASQQTGKTSTPKSIDPINFPVWETPVNVKKLIYVPNHTMTDLDGNAIFAMDKGAFHPLQVGKAFYTKRCYNGVVNDAIGYDGSCPYCESLDENWELVNKSFAQLCKQRAVDPKDPADPLKEDRKSLMNNMVIKKGEVFVTFPIVEIETEPNTIKVKLTDGNISYKTYWYTARESTYIDKWLKPLSALETEDGDPVTHPGGRWLILDYTYESKSGEHDKMGSGKALQVTHKVMKEDFTKVAQMLDEETAEWTPLKATQTVISNFYLTLEDATEIVDEAMKDTREKLEMMRACEVAVAPINGTPVAPVTGSPEASLSNFGATAVTDGVPVVPQGIGASDVGAVPQVPVN